MPLVPTIFGLGWASGVNAYATLGLLGILGRAGVGDVPPDLTKKPVIVAALLMYAIEFVVDKVPYLDSTWDIIHTAVRPAIGSALGVEFADQQSAVAILGGMGGGGTALASHSIKAGLRLAINTSPEPFTNVAASVGEDLAAGLVTALALQHPYIAAGISAFFLIAGAVLFVVLFRIIRRAYRSWRARRTAAGKGRDGRGRDPPG